MRLDLVSAAVAQASSVAGSSPSLGEIAAPMRTSGVTLRSPSPIGSPRCAASDFSASAAPLGPEPSQNQMAKQSRSTWASGRAPPSAWSSRCAKLRRTFSAPGRSTAAWRSNWAKRTTPSSPALRDSRPMSLAIAASSGSRVGRPVTGWRLASLMAHRLQPVRDRVHVVHHPQHLVGGRIDLQTVAGQHGAGAGAVGDRAQRDQQSAQRQQRNQAHRQRARHQRRQLAMIGEGRRPERQADHQAPTAAPPPRWRRSAPWPGTTAAECRAELGKSGGCPCLRAGRWFKGQSTLSPWTAFYSVYFLSESVGNSDLAHMRWCCSQIGNQTTSLRNRSGAISPGGLGIADDPDRARLPPRPPARATSSWSCSTASTGTCWALTAGPEFATPNLDRFAGRARCASPATTPARCPACRPGTTSSAARWISSGAPGARWRSGRTRSPTPLRDAGVVTQLISDHPHLFETGGENYHCRLHRLGLSARPRRRPLEAPGPIPAGPARRRSVAQPDALRQQPRLVPRRGRLPRPASTMSRRDPLDRGQRRPPRPLLPVRRRVRSARAVRHAGALGLEIRPRLGGART